MPANVYPDTLTTVGGSVPSQINQATPVIATLPVASSPVSGGVHSTFIFHGANMFTDPNSGYSVAYITTASTTNIASGGGMISKIINNGTVTSAAITVYDSTAASGSIIWKGTIAAGGVQELRAPTQNGVTIVTGDVGPYTVHYGN